MAKAHGADRMLEKYQRPHSDVVAIVEKMTMSGKYSTVERTSTGGIFAIEKGKAKHKAEEIEAGRFMAEKGYHVTLKDETGFVKTPDGELFSFTFEQRAPQSNSARSVRKALEHARLKPADVAVIYDKHAVYNRKIVEQGISLYEEYIKNYRFKRIIVISKAGNVYEHKHDR